MNVRVPTAREIELLDRRAQARRVTTALVSRTVLFGACQAAVAGLYALLGSDAPWQASVAWWPVSVVAANIFSLALLRRFLHADGHHYRDLLRFDRSTVRTDLLMTLGALLVAGVLAVVPNIGLASLLWDDPNAPLSVFIQPLPVWAAMVALVGFPITIALSELPLYYGYARPRLESLQGSAWLAVLFAGTAHALQHVALPLVFDARFLVWRGLMFLPFALFVGALLRWRPRLLPYLVIAHGLLDASVGLMVLQAAR